MADHMHSPTNQHSNQYPNQRIADRRAVVVTGVSTGIGYATAQALINHGYFVVGTVRKGEDADRLRVELGEHFHPVVVDLTEDEQVVAAGQEVAALVGEHGLAALINNAGIAIAGPLMHIDLDDLRYQFDVNVAGTVAITQAMLPLLGARRDLRGRPGRIINISSVSGHNTYPFLAPYAASKHALEAVSDGLRRELMLYGIDVIIMILGAVQTPMWEKAENLDIARYQTTDYAASVTQMHSTVRETRLTGMPVARVTQAIRQALEAPKPRTRYLLANSYWFGWVLPRWLPDRVFDRILSRQLGLARTKLVDNSSTDATSDATPDEPTDDSARPVVPPK